MVLESEIRAIDARQTHTGQTHREAATHTHMQTGRLAERHTHTHTHKHTHQSQLEGSVIRDKLQTVLDEGLRKRNWRKIWRKKKSDIRRDCGGTTVCNSTGAATAQYGRLPYLPTRLLPKMSGTDVA
eukprot:3817249-Rhodomonas_salina.1